MMLANFETCAEGSVEALEREERLRLAIEASCLETWDWGIPTGEVTWSGCIETPDGHCRKEARVVHAAFLDMVHPDDRELVAGHIAEAIAHHTKYRIEFRLIRPDGALRWKRGVGRAFYDQAGRPTRMTGVALDITDRKQREQALEEANRRLGDAIDRERATQAQIIEQERLSTLGQMASGIAHDVNNMLFMIIGYSEMLVADPACLGDGAEVSEVARLINAAAEDAATMVTRLRELYRHRGESEAHASIQLDTLIADAIALARNIAQPHGRPALQYSYTV